MERDGLFDRVVASTYDEDHAERFAADVIGPTVSVLADLAAGGRALELAVGTGRVALPLVERGVEVVGIELSQAMVDEMAAKPGADRVPVVIGDMATTCVGGEFSLVYLVYSTITNLLTQDEQVACFANAAAHLAPGGRFVVEVGVPSLRRLPPGARFVGQEATDRHIGVDELDPRTQSMTCHHTYVRDGEASVFRSRHRYVWPSELDLMARLAGLELEHRWSDWHRAPFTADSASHISVWRKPPG
ncbi:class I SAM-dependent DNA methyltransferase [Dermatobacter hominis]|uniref:class I SAM-dependent DNA methyltransferase n=1 Tax=Dermatobacter hominis TaxID=2884263 RepID=UPI001D0FD52B|nr:class I SAM-dependent methyltransferase [Dermatobacter hominis]UDY37654.1 methyltransferase domain-containing protein [Dermatobacter hominis]